MKKLLLVLLVVTLASFLFVGCLPGTTTPAEGEGEGEGEAEICPTVSVTSQVAIEGKTYIKGGKQTITVTFAVPTEPVSVYVGVDLKEIYNPFIDPGVEIVMYANADKTVYTGTTVFTKDALEDCNEAYIYVITCDTCAPCKYPYIVDTGKPFIGTVEICVDTCTCDGCILTFTSKKTADCDPCDPKVYCGDCCSGFASWSVQIYNKNPFDVCCDTPCVEPIDEGTGTCQVDWETACLLESTVGSGTRTVYALVTAYDMVGNKLKQLATVTFNPDTCDEIAVSEILPGEEAYNCVVTPDIVACTLAEQQNQIKPYHI